MRGYFKPVTLVVALLIFVAVACGDGTSDDTAASGDTAAGDVVDPATYYEDQIIRFVTSSGAGGGTDTKIRTLAIQLPRYIG
jgi:hypothetical protein